MRPIDTKRLGKGSPPPQFRGYLFDIDGVVCLGNQPVPDASHVLHTLHKQGRQLMFVSNTSSRSAEQVLAIFRGMQLPIGREDVFVASEETAKHLAKMRPGGKVYMIGSSGLQRALERAGLNVHPATDRAPEGADFVVVGKDSELTYLKLTSALRALQQGALFVAVNEDPTVPAADGLEPGAGAIVAALSTMTGRKPDISIGKPGPFLFRLALQRAGLKPEECLMVGDTPSVDVAGAKGVGMPSALVTMGNYAPSDDPLTQPDWVIDSLSELICEAASVQAPAGA